MPTNPDLAALSAAATPGEWLVEPDMRIDTRYTPDREEYEYLAGYNVMGDVEVIGCEGIIPGGQAEANAAFIVGLVNAYRTGNLIQFDRDGMRALHERIVSRPHDAPMHIEHLLDDADAAIAEILGGEV